jgi:hypothetical protein
MSVVLDRDCDEGMRIVPELPHGGVGRSGVPHPHGWKEQPGATFWKAEAAPMLSYRCGSLR